jgi:LPXTG-motif cell wall-anchored protein
MYYGSGSVNNQGIGVAFSSDGQNFTKSSSNPIFYITDGFPWRNDRTYTPFVIPDGVNWIMYYSGRSTPAGVYSIGYALPTPLPPAGSITIDSGAATTNSTTVTLTLSCSDSTGCTHMCISNTSSCSSWESYSSTKTWTIPLGDGTKTVYARFRNGVGNENISPYSDSIILDSSVPTPSGANVTVTFSNGATITYDNIASNCSTNLRAVTTPDHNPPSKFRFISGGYFDIATNCSYSGNITIKLPYDPTDVQGGENNLKLFHWKNNGWQDCTVSLNTASNTITGRVTSLSPFGIGYPYSSGGGSGGGGGGGGYSTGANENMIALIAILAISAGLFLLRRKRWLRKA